MDCGIVFHILYFGIIVFRHPVLRALVQNKRQWRFESQYSGQMIFARDNADMGRKT